MRLAAVVLMLALVTYLPTSAYAQGCSTCQIGTTVLINASVNQAVCLGPNAVVCNFRYTKNTSSMCVGGQALRDCKPRVKKVRYATMKFAPGTCGIDTGPTFAGCGVPGGGPGVAIRDSHDCSGGPWLISASLPANQQFALQLVTPGGRTVLQSRTTALDETLVVIPAALISATAERLQVEGDNFVVRVEVEILQPSIYSIPSQPVTLKTPGMGISLKSAVVVDGRVVIEIEIAREDVGAVAEYWIDLNGVMVERGDVSDVQEKPTLETPQPVSARPGFLMLSAVAFSGDLELTSGAAIVGRPPDSDVSAPEPDADPTREDFYFLASLVLLFLLFLSWGIMLVRRRGRTT